MTLTLEKLASICDAEIIGGDQTIEISSAADIKSAGLHQVTLLNDLKYVKYLADSKASACFMNAEIAKNPTPDSMSILICQDPEISFIKAVQILFPEPSHPKTIAEQSAIAETALLGSNVHIAPFVSIGEHSNIGNGSEILNGASIGNHVEIGKNCRIYQNVVIYDHAKLGDNVIIHAGSVIGADGFGYKQRNQQHIKVPHVGNIIIENDVEIGANSCIDRGTLGSTVIGEGTKIDNLVQIGHNNNIGKNVIICGQTGISGSCHIEDNVILAGSAGIADHVRIGHHSVVMARSGVAGDIEPGMQVFGSPAKDRKAAWKEMAALAKLPQLIKKIKNLEEKINKAGL